MRSDTASRPFHADHKAESIPLPVHHPSRSSSRRKRTLRNFLDFGSLSFGAMEPLSTAAGAFDQLPKG
jgi:hypothetical protein